MLKFSKTNKSDLLDERLMGEGGGGAPAPCAPPLDPPLICRVLMALVKCLEGKNRRFLSVYDIVTPLATSYYAYILRLCRQQRLEMYKPITLLLVHARGVTIP